MSLKLLHVDFNQERLRLRFEDKNNNLFFIESSYESRYCLKISYSKSYVVQKKKSSLILTEDQLLFLKSNLKTNKPINFTDGISWNNPLFHYLELFEALSLACNKTSLNEWFTEHIFYNKSLCELWTLYNEKT
jgi:hypothetical protein